MLHPILNIGILFDWWEEILPIWLYNVLYPLSLTIL